MRLRYRKWRLSLLRTPCAVVVADVVARYSERAGNAASGVSDATAGAANASGYSADDLTATVTNGVAVSSFADAGKAKQTNNRENKQISFHYHYQYPFL